MRQKRVMPQVRMRIEGHRRKEDHHGLVQGVGGFNGYVKRRIIECALRALHPVHNAAAARRGLATPTNSHASFGRKLLQICHADGTHRSACGEPILDAANPAATLPSVVQVTGGAAVAIKKGMADALSRRLKQAEFASPAQEALLSVIVAAATLNERMERLCAQFDITHAQYNVLRILRGVYPEGHARCEIACRMLDRASDVTRLTNRLETRKLVKRYRGSQDQRQTVTYITAKGLKLLDTMRPHVESEISNILQRLNESDCRDLTTLCGMIFEEEQHLAPGN